MMKRKRAVGRRRRPRSGRDWIGLVEVTGVIRHADPTVRALRQMRLDPHIRAVVVRIDSPGGAVVPSQEIFEAVRRLRGAKTVVASMGAVAASGGYYIAAAADRIYASPGTITGSIGVIMQLSNLEEAMGKVGVRPVTVRAGSHKDVGSPTKPLTARDRAYLQDLADRMYEQFVGAVAAGRRLPLNRARALAEGRIYTGADALALGLVDRMGTLEDAIEETAKLMGVVGEPKVLRVQRPSRWRRLFGAFASLVAESLRDELGRGALAPALPQVAYLAPGPWATEA